MKRHKNRPQKELPPEERNSRLYSFRVNRESGDINDARVRVILDQWLEDGIFTGMIKKGVLLAENTEPITNQELSRWLVGIGEDLQAVTLEQGKRLAQMEEYNRQLVQLIKHVSSGEVIRELPQETKQAFPDGFLDVVLGAFDE